jgi:hypothetical protein
MAYNLVLASDGPENCAEYFTRRLCCWVPSGSESFRKYLNQQYYDVLNHVLTSRHRRRIGGDFLRYTKKQKRYLPSEYTNSWKKLTCIYHRGHAPTSALTNTFTNAPHDSLLSQWGLLPPTK